MLACFLRSKWTGSGKVALMITGVFFLVEKVRGHENKTSGENLFEDMYLVRVFINHLTARKWKKRQEVGLLKLYMNIKVVRDRTSRGRWFRKIQTGTTPSECGIGRTPSKTPGAAETQIKSSSAPKCNAWYDHNRCVSER